MSRVCSAKKVANVPEKKGHSPHARKTRSLYLPSTLAGRRPKSSSTSPPETRAEPKKIRMQRMTVHFDNRNYEAPAAERRRHPRNEVSTCAVVRGVDTSGQPFEAEGDVRDVSAGGLSVRLDYEVEPGAELAAEVALCPSPDRLAASGRVTRVELLIDGRRGVAVAFTSHSFF